MNETCLKRLYLDIPEHRTLINTLLNTWGETIMLDGVRVRIMSLMGRINDWQIPYRPYILIHYREVND